MSMKSYHWIQRRPDGMTVPMMSRRELVLGAAAAGAIPGGAGVEAEEISGLVERAAASEVAWIRGDMQRFLSLVSHSEDYLLLSPFGGPPRRGFDTSPARLAELSRYFRGGSGTVDVVQTLPSARMVVLAMIARLRGTVGELPEQDWPLRITQVYRREAAGWRVVHRHADMLLHKLGLEQMAALARG
jgi:ketosteroid isomerase-like protein